VCDAGYTETGYRTCVSCDEHAEVVGYTILKGLLVLALIAGCIALAREHVAATQQDAAVSPKDMTAATTSLGPFRRMVRASSVVAMRIIQRLRIPLVVYQVQHPHTAHLCRLRCIHPILHCRT
jgi:hypothetical protein